MAQQTQTPTDDATDEQTYRVEVHHLMRGDRRNDEDAALADDIRHEFRFDDERETVDEDEFDRLYSLVGTDEVTAGDAFLALEQAWERWNAGLEIPDPLAEAEVRSLEVCDVLRLTGGDRDGQAFIVGSFGWDRAEHLDGHADTDEDKSNSPEGDR